MNETTGVRWRWCRARPRRAGVVAVTAGIVLLVVGCGVLERPWPVVVHAAGTTVQSTGNGIQVQTGDERMLGLMNGGAQKVTYTLDAQGSMVARYTDPETGYVTINTVYAQ